MSNIENSLKNLGPVESRKLRKIWINLVSTGSKKLQSLLTLGLIISTCLKTDLYSTIIKVLEEGRIISKYSREEILEHLFVKLLIDNIKKPIVNQAIYKYIRRFRRYSILSDEEIFQLKALNLAINEITSLHENLGDLSNLEMLYLNNNSLTSLPESLGKLSNLEKLWLSHNRLNYLPESFGNLTNLKEILLKDNQLTSLPESFGNLSNLQVLVLSENRLSSLPESFGNLSKLQRLSLNKNQLSSLPESFGDLSDLVDLYLPENQLTSLPESFEYLTNLKELDLSFNQLNSQAESVLKNLVMTNSVITRLFTDDFDFSKEIDRNKRGVPAPGRTTVKAAEFY